jgi:transposase
MVVADGQGIPLACSTSSESPAEVKLVEGVLIQAPRPEDRSIPLIADRAYDCDPLRERLKQSKWDLICPHRKGRKRAPTQDVRKLRRYRRRWTIERTFAWLGNFRRLLVRHEFYVTMYDAFMHLACAMICIRRF